MLRPAHGGDLPEVLVLLAEAGLPSAGLGEHLGTLLVATTPGPGGDAGLGDAGLGGDFGGRVVGSAGLELYGSGALLRSVVVAPGLRDRGLGADLVRAALALAAERGVTRVYLLTETAEGYFARLGFRRVEREAVEGGVTGSVEFTDACPLSATAMLWVADPQSAPA